jgi:hypothetical protein
VKWLDATAKRLKKDRRPADLASANCLQECTSSCAETLDVLPLAAVDNRGARQCVLHREGRHRAGARLFLFPGRARSALCGQAAQQGRGPPHGGKLRQAAGAAAAEGPRKASRTSLARSNDAVSLVAPAFGACTQVRR